jgi:hypothetical protein
MKRYPATVAHYLDLRMIGLRTLDEIDALRRAAQAVRDTWIDLGCPGSPEEDLEEQPLEVIRLGWASIDTVPALLSEREELERTLRRFEQERVARAAACPCCGRVGAHEPACRAPALIR